MRTYVITSDSGTTVLVVLPDRTVEGYEAHQSWKRFYEPHGYPVTRKQAADFIKHARKPFIDIFTRPYGIFRIVENGKEN